MDRSEQIVARYLNAIHSHDIEGALACLCDTFELRFTGSSFVMGKEAAASAIGWDAGANGRLAWHVADTGDHTVTVDGRETNDFLELVGIGSLRFRSTFAVGPDGIESQTHTVDWGPVTLETAMKPLLDWATSCFPDEVAALRPGGRMVYNRWAAERWVALARRWKESVGD